MPFFKHSIATKVAVPARLLTITIFQLSLKPVIFLYVSHPTYNKDHHGRRTRGIVILIRSG